MPDSSQYTALVKVKSSVVGKAYSNGNKQNVPYIYNSYFPLYRILPNALSSNKFRTPPYIAPILSGTNALWATYINGSRITHIQKYLTTTDSSGNVYVAICYKSDLPITLKNANGNGQIDSSFVLPASIYDNVCLIKCNSLGQILWATYMNVPADCSLGNFIIDSIGNVYVVGNYNSSSEVTLKNANGNGQVDSSVKLPSTSGHTNAFLIKYNNLGITQLATYLGENFSKFDGISTDSIGNVYIIGAYFSFSEVTLKNASGNGQVDSSVKLPSGPSGNLFLIKYNNSGIAQWATYLTANVITLTFVSTDPTGNLYVVGTYSSSSEVTLKNASGNGQVDSSVKLPITPLYDNGFLIKYNSSGIAQWATYLGSDASEFTNCSTDSIGNVYVVGNYNSSSEVTLKNASGNGQVDSSVKLPALPTAYLPFLIKYNNLGIAQWATNLRTANVSVRDVSTDSTGSVYVIGNYNSSSEFILKNANGDGQVDSSFKLPSTSGHTNAFLIKYNNLGITQLATYLMAVSASFNDVSTDPTGNLYVVGTYSSSSEVTLKNASGNGQVDSSVKLPSTSTYTTPLLIKYSQY